MAAPLNPKKHKRIVIAEATAQVKRLRQAADALKQAIDCCAAEGGDVKALEALLRLAVD